MEEHDDVDQLRADVKQLRALISAELKRGSDADRDIVLAAATLLEEKINQLRTLGWLE